MKSIVTYKAKQNALTIEIKPNWKSIVGFGYLSIALPFFIFLLIGIYLIIGDLGIVFRFDQRSLFFVGLMIVSGYFLNVILRRIFQTEIAIVKDDQLVLRKKLLFKTDKIAFEKNEIKDFRYVGTESFTNHTFAIQGFDYLGFNTEERQIQNLIEDGKIAFFYHGSIYRFGKDLYADQGEKIIEQIENWC